MDIVKIVDPHMSENSYVVVDGEDAVIIDCGCFVEKIEEVLDVFSPRPTVRGIFLTHAHFDHIRELDSAVAKYKCPVYIHKSGKTHLYDEKKNMSIMDKPFKIKSKKEVETFVDGGVVNCGDICVACYNTPGHSIDSSCFVVGDNMFTGDTVFRVDAGRCDLYSGDDNMLEISLRRVRDELSEGVNHFYAGHGANFTKEELKYNVARFLGDE